MSDLHNKNLESEIDDLLIKILELMNEQIQCKMNVERTLRSGCLDLAKTRYILGSTHRVSAMAIPTEEIKATTTVISSKTEEGRTLFELNKENINKSTNDKPSSTQDPLKWFGILVPTNLRQGQTWFSKALDFSVQSANVSAEISTSLEKYETLLKNKKSFSEVTETDSLQL